MPHMDLFSLSMYAKSISATYCNVLNNDWRADYYLSLGYHVGSCDHWTTKLVYTYNYCILHAVNM